jgi:serine/threonine protein kinase
MARDEVFDLQQARRHVGKYEVLTRLSVGGMAELFLAFLPGPGGFKKFVALKQILPDIKADESFVKMFLDEARLTAQLSHANIAQVFDLGEDEASGELYLAMEFVPGQNLEQVVRRAAKDRVAIPIGFAARVMRDTCLALHSAHSFVEPGTGKPMPIVHRDVSPKNVMVTYTGPVKVIDFGIAKARGRLNRTQVGIVKGTSGYMAPEQVRNEPLDGRSDLFAAGVILHELLVGERLYQRPTDAAMMMAIADEAPPSPLTKNPACPETLAKVALKALAKNRDQRFLNGKDFAKAIEQATPELFDDEDCAGFMASLFADNIDSTRKLFDLAKDVGADTDLISKALGALVEGETVRKHIDDVKPPAKRSKTAKAEQPPPAPSETPPPPPDVTVRRAAPRSRQALSEVSDGDTPPNGLPAIGPPLPPSGRRSSSWLPLVVLPVGLIVVGAGWLALQSGRWSFESDDVDAGAEPLTLKPSEKPKWLLEREAQVTQLEAEKERQRALEAAQSDPDRQQLLAEVEEQIRRLNRLEEEQRALQVEQKLGKSAAVETQKRYEELQKQIDDLKKSLAGRSGKTPPRAASDAGEIEIVKDARSARQAALGYLTLKTFAPSRARVFDELGNELGETPLVRVNLPQGDHELRVLDDEARRHVLLVRIEAGKVTDLKGVMVSSLPLLP